MSRKWLEHEGVKWVDKQIITQAQYNKLLGLYEEKKHAVGVLPVLGSVLVGLGILSFIAANWQDITPWLRMLIVIGAMAGFYAGGERLLNKGQDRLGIAIVGLGLISFGAGIILVGQMFHLTSYTASSFIVWGTAGILLTYIYRSHYLFFISLIIFHAAQLYSTSSFESFSYTALVIMTAGLGYYVFKQQSSLLTWFLCLSVLFHTLLLATSKEWKLLWFLVPVMAMYAAGDWVRNRTKLTAIQSAPLLAAYLVGLFIVLFSEDGYGLRLIEDVLADARIYLPVMLVLFAVSAVGKWRNHRETSAFEWLLFLPVAYLPAKSVELITLLVLFLFSLYMLWRGYAEEWRLKINIGTILFLFTTMIAYGKLTWNFMDKSLFFIMGGVMLLVLSWLLNRRRRQFLDDSKEG
ncbi:MAG: hypothetical protein K0R67_3523 [Paenibacillus sp.]|jgi:uncharacterized membrane protein|nr:hypothetical protein [Paenibacillus sp.]